MVLERGSLRHAYLDNRSLMHIFSKSICHWVVCSTPHALSPDALSPHTLSPDGLTENVLSSEKFSPR